MEDLDLEELVLREHGRDNNNDWGGCKRAPKAEIDHLPREGTVARPQAWGSGTVELLGHRNPLLLPATPQGIGLIRK